MKNKSRFYTPDVMLNLVPTIKNRGDIIKIIEKYSFSENGFRKALMKYKDFYKITHKSKKYYINQRIKKLKKNIEFLEIAYKSWKKGNDLKSFSKSINTEYTTVIKKLNRFGIYWLKNIEASETDLRFKNIIREMKIELGDQEREFTLC